MKIAVTLVVSLLSASATARPCEGGVPIGAWRFAETICVLDDPCKHGYHVGTGYQGAGSLGVYCWNGGEEYESFVIGDDFVTEPNDARQYIIDHTARFEAANDTLTRDQAAALAQAQKSIRVIVMGKGSFTLAVSDTPRAFATLYAACDAAE